MVRSEDSKLGNLSLISSDWLFILPWVVTGWRRETVAETMAKPCSNNQACPPPPSVVSSSHTTLSHQEAGRCLCLFIGILSYWVRAAAISQGWHWHWTQKKQWGRLLPTSTTRGWTLPLPSTEVGAIARSALHSGQTHAKRLPYPSLASLGGGKRGCAHVSELGQLKVTFGEAEEQSSSKEVSPGLTQAPRKFWIKSIKNFFFSFFP